MQFVKYFFLLVCCALPFSALATSADPMLIEANKQLAAKDYPALNALLDPLLATPEPPLEALFLSGMAASEQGDYATAISRFRAMLTRDPGLLRSRLELARALQLSGDRQAAIYNYEQVLSAPLPDQVRRNIYAQLDDIRLRIPSFRLTTELVSDSNPQQVTSSQVVFIGGRPYTLNNPNQGKLQWGMAVTAGITYPLPSDPSWFAQFYGQTYEYPGRELDSLYAQSILGKRFEFGPSELTLSAGGQVSTYQDRRQYTGWVARATGLRRMTPNLAWQGDMSVNTYRYPDYPYLDGELSTLGLTAVLIPNPTQRWELGAFVAHNGAAEDAYSYLQPGVNLFASQEWMEGWITGLRLLASKARYGATDPFFGEVRKDTEGRVELIVANRKLRWAGFSPLLTVGYVERDSTLEINRYDRLYGRVGLTTVF
jgi:tetratricopeptide (TPR) repeat protein